MQRSKYTYQLRIVVCHLYFAISIYGLIYSFMHEHCRVICRNIDTHKHIHITHINIRTCTHTCMYNPVQIHILTRILVNACTYTHTHIHTDMHTCTQASTCTHTHMHTRTSLHRHLHRHTHIHTHTHTHTRTHTSTHTYAHICIVYKMNIITI